MSYEDSENAGGAFSSFIIPHSVVRYNKRDKSANWMT